MRLAVLAALAALAAVGSTGVGASVRASSPPRVVQGPRDSHLLDLDQLVPRRARIDGVWVVPPGRTRSQLALVWHLPAPASAWPTGARWFLTLWNPEGRYTLLQTRWVAHALVVSSPWQPFVRLADVTHDGHADLLVTVPIAGANHGAEAVSVFATFGRHVRRIYGSGFYPDQQGHGVHGRALSESTWGARHGLLWFVEPRGGQAVCCPDFELHYALRWTARGWRTASRRLVRIHYG